MKVVTLCVLLFVLCVPASAQFAPYISPTVQFLDNTGKPCSGCTLTAFAAGTTTPQNMFTDNTGVTPTANPLTLDSAGRATIFLSTASYKFVLKSTLGATITQVDGVTWANLAQTLNALTLTGNATINSSTAATSGANQSGPSFSWCGNVWNGSASIADCWAMGDVIGSGSNGTSTLTLTHSGSSGTPVFSVPALSATSASVSGAVTGKSVNGIQKAEQFAGATADVKIAACLTAVSSGGTCDARGFGATTQSIAATITVANHESLLFDPATNFQAATSSLNLFTFQPGSIIKGFNFDCTNQPSYTGVLFQNDTTKQYGNWDLTELGEISTNLSCASVTGFTALKLTSSSNTLGVSFVKFHGWRIIGGTDGVFMTTTSTGFVNGNHLSDMVFSNTAHGWHITGVASGAIQGNVCTPCSFEKDSTNGVNGVLIDGSSGQVDGNQWYGAIWDTTVPVSITNSGANVLKNLFAGYMNGSPSDVNGVNNFIYTSNSTLLPNLVFEGARINTVGNSLDLFDPTSGATTPHKFIRVGQGAGNGILEILNSAFGADILTLSDSGNVVFAGTGTFSGNAITGGSGGLTINAGGSAQNVTLTPSGAGVVNISAGGGLFINGSVLSDLSRNITAGTGAFSGVITSTKATGTAPFTITSTTPVANLTASAIVYGTTGTQAANSHAVIGVCTLGTNCAVTLSGSAVYTSSGSYQCTANDASAAAAVQVNQISGSAVTFTGTGTDAVRFSCTGN